MTRLVGVSSDVTVMMSESRQQNTEVRLAVGSIADKVDRLTEKVRCSKSTYVWKRHINSTDCPFM